MQKHAIDTQNAISESALTRLDITGNYALYLLTWMWTRHIDAQACNKKNTMSHKSIPKQGHSTIINPVYSYLPRNIEWWEPPQKNIFSSPLFVNKSIQYDWPLSLLLLPLCSAHVCMCVCLCSCLSLIACYIITQLLSSRGLVNWL